MTRHIDRQFCDLLGSTIARGTVMIPYSRIVRTLDRFHPTKCLIVGLETIVLEPDIFSAHTAHPLREILNKLMMKPIKQEGS